MSNVGEELCSVMLLLFCVFMLKRCSSPVAPLLSSSGIVLISLVTLLSFWELISSVTPFLTGAEASGAVKQLLKLVGVGYLFGVCTDICREMGETGVADSLQTMGRVEIALICVPTVRSILELAQELI